MATIKLDDTIVKALPAPRDRAYTITWDTKISGFGVRVTAGGARAFILNYRTRHGRERRYTIGSFPDWKTGAAHIEAAELKKRIDQGGDPLGELKAGREAPTVNGLCDRFIAEYLPRKRPSTRKSYSQIIDAEVRPVLGRLKVAEVAFSDIDTVHHKISKRARYRANRVVAVLSRMFSMAIRWQMRSDNPSKGIERNDEAARRRYLSPDELLRLGVALSELRDQQSANIIRILLLTGARRGEVLAARWKDFGEEFATWTKPGATTKQRTVHSVPLSLAASQLLRDIRQRVPEGTEWVFPASSGSHRRDVKDAWATLCAAAKISGARVHDLRHTYASVLASAGLSLPVIGALLGHTQPATTARYAHLYDDPLRTATQRAADIITGRPSADVVPMKGALK